MMNFLQSLSSFIVAHSLFIGAIAFVVLRQKLSRRLSHFFVRKYFAGNPPAPVSVHHYAGWYDQLAHYIPDVIEERVMQRAREANVSREVRLQFIDLVLGNAFLLIIAIGVFLSGFLLASLHFMTLSAFAFLTRLMIYGILIQNVYKAYKYRELLRLENLKAFYDQYGFNLIRFIECQIASIVYKQAYREIDENVQKMSAVERFVYRNFSDGTSHYAYAISRHALHENRRFIRIILALALASTGIYYFILYFVVAPVVVAATHMGLFHFLFVMPFEQSAVLIAAHPLWLIFLMALGLFFYHYRWNIFLRIAPALEKVLKTVAQQ